MNNLMVFENQQVEILNFNGQALFNPYDVGKCLDIDEVTVRRHIQSMNNKQVIKLSNSIVQNMNFRKLHNTGENFLTKSGVYKLVFKSHKPIAEKFQDWVTDEVLPQIEQTGGYIQTDREEEFIDKYFPSFTEDTKLNMIHDLRNQNKLYKDQISQLKPQAKAFNNLMQASGYLQFLEICGVVDKGRNSLLKFLRDNKVLTKQSIHNVPYERFKKNGMFKVVSKCDIEGKFSVITLVSPKGLAYIYKLLEKKNMLNNFNSSLLVKPTNMGVVA